MFQTLASGIEFLAGVESDDAASGERDFLAGLGVAAWRLRLIAHLEIAET